MDVKSGIILPVPPQAAAGQGVSAAAEKNSPPPPAGKADGGKAPDVAVVQEVMRGALNVEPVADRELRIEFEAELHQIVVKVLDKESGELIRQIPMPEEISIAKGIRAAIRKMAGNQSGIAVDKEV
jgi:uncharacterized FlaG/YvyC family protein